MNLRNNIYAEAMLAHFHNFFYYHNNTSGNEDPAPTEHGYPDGFFNWFYTIKSNTIEGIEEQNQDLRRQILESIGTLPQLENTAPPIVKYHRIFGIKINLKSITVPHPDGRITTFIYRYHFYKLRYMLKYLIEKDRFSKAEIYNKHLKERKISVYPDTIPLIYLQGSWQEIIEEHQQKEYTRKRQCLAIFYLLEEMGVDISTVNLSDVTRLLHLFSAKEIPLDRSETEKIANSTTYKMLRNVKNQVCQANQTDIIFIKSIIFPLAEQHNSKLLKRLCKRLIIK
ncbi:MAG: hypothetical protein ACO1PI_04650 [Bacteroidota bacterium]